MPIVFQVRNRLIEDYSPRKQPVWVNVKRSGVKWQDPETGQVIELFKIGTLAEALDRTTKVLLEKWEATGILPPPLFYLEGERHKRWYSAEQVVNCHRVMRCKYGGRKYFQNKELFAQFTSDIKKVWYSSSVVVSEQGEITL